MRARKGCRKRAARRSVEPEPSNRRCRRWMCRRVAIGQCNKELVMATGVAAGWVPVEDMSRAVAFYRDALGFDVDEQDTDWSEVDANGVKIGLNAREKAVKHSDGGAVISFQPEGDIEAEVAE